MSLADPLAAMRGQEAQATGGGSGKGVGLVKIPDVLHVYLFVCLGGVVHTSMAGEVGEDGVIRRIWVSLEG